MSSSLSSAEPLVSVVIPTYNQSRYLRQSIESVLAQTYPRVEVIVVDDGSTDDTSQAVAGFGSRVRYIRQANKGTAAARNAGISHAAGELIAFLDHDDLWLPEKLALQVPLFSIDPDLGLAYGAIRFFDDQTGQVTCEHFPGERLDFHDLLGHQIISLQTSIVPKAILEDIGGFDESLFGTDDWDLCIRVTARHAARGINQPLVNIRLHQAHASAATDRMYTNEWAVVNKNSRIHSGCGACRSALRHTRRELRANQYIRRCQQAKAEKREGRYLSSIATRCGAMLRYPRAINHLPRRIAERCLGFAKAK